jgi:hypothetical protein
MGQHIDQIIIAARRGFGYAEKLAADITPEIFASKPRFRDAGREVVVDCNHPAFVYGHLSLYPARLMGFLGLDTAPVAFPSAWPDLFKAGVECRDDPEGTIYPKKSEIMPIFARGYAALFDAMGKLDDAVITTPHPDETIRAKFFPTLGVALAFMPIGHVMMHMGQVSTWRRCFGLPGVM